MLQSTIKGQDNEKGFNIDTLLISLGEKNKKSQIYGDEIKTKSGHINTWLKLSKRHRDNWEKGFMIIKADTLKGEFKLSNSTGNLIHVYYRKDSIAKQKKIRADKFDYMFKGQSHYISKKVQDVPEYIRIMENGVIKLLAKETKGNAYTYPGIIVDYYLEKGEELIGPITKLGFSELADFFMECPELSIKIKRKEVTFFQLREIVQIYNLYMIKQDKNNSR
jgi:hypothetical protein